MHKSLNHGIRFRDILYGGHIQERAEMDPGVLETTGSSNRNTTPKRFLDNLIRNTAYKPS